MGETEIKNSYEKIILKLKSLSVDEEVFKQKKHNFQQEIDSPRRLFLMSSLGDLIDYLERKLLIRSNKIRLITKILDVFEIFGIRKLIIEHNMLLTNYNYSNDRIDYKEDNAKNQNITSDHSIPPCVVELISSRIGNSWKEMAYELQFKAGEIDLIDENLESDVKKSLEILNTYISRPPQDCKRGRLINALSNIRRMLLRDEVEHLLMMSCLNCRLPSANC